MYKALLLDRPARGGARPYIRIRGYDAACCVSGRGGTASYGTTATFSREPFFRKAPLFLLLLW